MATEPFMLHLGKAARYVREATGLNQAAAARELEISNVHLCNIENGKSAPSPDLIARYQKRFGVDIYVVAWCMFGKHDSLPQGVRAAAKKLEDAWKRQIESGIAKNRSD